MASRAFSPQAGPSRSPDWQLYRDDVSSIVDSETTERTVRGVEPTLPIHMHDHVRSKWWDREFSSLVGPSVHPSLDHSYSSQLNDAADEDSQSYIEPEEGAISGLDMEKAMPHPEALYDFDTNAWLIVCIRPTSRQLKRNSFQPRDIPLTFGVTNPAQRSFVTDEQGLREREPLCSSAPELDDDGGRTIRHHHLHTFSRAVPYTSFLYSEAGNPPPSLRETVQEVEDVRQTAHHAAGCLT
ncbi:hypothetical protein BKA62DRAFT_770804 [Auriculariales sp. MPI-PUGE-AT-0066]|nr:hypothetical protein BKA62DRAFT_770804 [Auriculariales sp. MPI-PUGE-AT-0066]